MDTLEGKAYACLLAGLVGDAMGTPTENLEPEQIERQFGWVREFEGPGTDDSLMKDLLSMALTCDLTRVATLQWTHGQSGTRFSWLGQSCCGMFDASKKASSTQL